MPEEGGLGHRHERDSDPERRAVEIPQVYLFVAQIIIQANRWSLAPASRGR
jgi:hypothetical protein